jgi:hypothetical protein
MQVGDFVAHLVSLRGSKISAWILAILADEPADTALPTKRSEINMAEKKPIKYGRITGGKAWVP